MKYFTLAAIAVIFWASPASAGKHQELDIKLQGRKIGYVENIRIKAADNDPSRLLIYLTANFGSFAQNLDRILRSKGNFKGCSTQIYWSGNTSVRGTGKSLGLSSRLRYEKWWCKKILGKRMKGRIFRDTKTVHWRLFIKPAPIDKIKIGARVENILNFPDDLERLLKIRVPKEIKINFPIPKSCGKCKCKKFTDSFKPEFTGSDFSSANGDVRIRVGFSIKGTLTKELLRCLYRT